MTIDAGDLRGSHGPRQEARLAHERGDEAVGRLVEHGSGVPSCTIRPARITATRSPTASASSWSWVTNTAGVPVERRIVDDVVADLGAQVRVEAGERLVEQQQRRPGRERPGQRHPLAFAARQLVRVAVAVAGRARPGRASRRPRRRRGGRRAHRSRRCRPPSGAGTGRAPGTPARRGGARAARDRWPSSTTSPPSSIVPVSVGCSPATMRSSVDLPQPLGPTSASSSCVGRASNVDLVDGDRRRRSASTPRRRARRVDGHRRAHAPVEPPRQQEHGDTATSDDRQRRQRRLLEPRLRGQVVDPHRQRVEAERAQQQHDRAAP